MLLLALVICAGVEGAEGAPETAPVALLQGFFDAPEVVERASDTYTLDAYVWRDSQPLIITGDPQALPSWLLT